MSWTPRLLLAGRSGWGRLCPPMLACLDELPSTAPLPTLRTRMANERALGISFIYAAQTWRQLAAVFGEQEARALFGLTNVLVMFGGSKDGAFNQEISDLVGQTRVSRTTWQTGAMAGRTFSGEDIAIIRPEEIRRLPERHALVIAENGKPIIARLSRCIDGRKGARLLAGQRRLRAELADRHSAALTAEARAAAALVEARRRGIAADPGSLTGDRESAQTCCWCSLSRRRASWWRWRTGNLIVPRPVARSRSALWGMRGCCPDRGSRRAAVPRSCGSSCGRGWTRLSTG